jgi:hypothetical protein
MRMLNVGPRSLVSIVLLAVAGCGPHIDPNGAFAKEVHPLLRGQCAACHSDDPASSETGPGDFAVEDMGRPTPPCSNIWNQPTPIAASSSNA